MIRYSRTDAGYSVHTDRRGHVGNVERDGRRWVAIATDGTRLEHPFATRVEAADALIVTARRVAEVEAVAELAEPVEVESPAVLAERAERAAAATVRVECPSCRYTGGHTSWCPRRHAEQPVEQTALELEDPTAPREDEPVSMWAARAYGEDLEPADAELDRTTPVAELDDRGVWLAFMLEDRAQSYGTPDDKRHGALLAEIARRWGPDATELTADYAVAVHMSSDDLVRWARDEHADLIALATGRRSPWWRRDDEVAVEDRTHGTGCAACDAVVESAVRIMRATGSTGATYGDAEHTATVSRRAERVG